MPVYTLVTPRQPPTKKRPSQYLRGREIEYKAVAELEARGYLAQRAASSKGNWDIYAVRADQVLLVSCKRASTEAIAKRTLAKERRKLAGLTDMLPKEHVRQALYIWLDNKGWYTMEEL